MGKTKLKGLFFRYVGYIGVWFLVVIVGMFVLVQLLFNAGVLRPADYLEKQLPSVFKALQQQTEVTSQAIPPDYDYAIFDSSGKVQATTLTERELTFTKGLGDDQELGGSWQKRYRAKKLPHGKVILSYRMMADFSSVRVRQYLPNGEVFFLGSSLVLIISGFLFLSQRFAQRINRELQKITQLAEKIEQLDLSVQLSTPTISEFATVQAALRQMQASLQKSLSKQWAAEQQLKTGIQAMAHDSKTPVTVIRGNLELLGLTELDDEQKNYLDYIETHLTRLQDYLEELSELANSQRVKGRPVLHSIESIQAKVSPLVTSMAAATNCLLTEQTVVTQAVVCLDMEELLRAIQNIIENACSYAGPGGRIWLSYQLERQWFKLTIFDDGPGFSSSALQQATEKFYTEDESRSRGTHYGLGLSLAEQLVVGNDGQLHLSNWEMDGQLGGARVQVSFPLADS